MAQSKALAHIRKMAAEKTTQQVTIAAVSGGAGAVAGKYLQEYLNTTKDGPVGSDGKPSVPLMRAVGSIPTGTVLGGVLAVAGLMATKGNTRAVLGSAGAGIAAGSYIVGSAYKA